MENKQTILLTNVENITYASKNDETLKETNTQIDKKKRAEIIKAILTLNK